MARKISLAPFASVSKSAPIRTFLVWCAVAPQIAALFQSQSRRSLLLLLASVLGAFLSEADALRKKESRALSASYALLAGTLAGLFLPEGFPAASAFFTTFLFMFASKSAFGPFGVSWINPVALSVTGAWFAGRLLFGPFEIAGADLLAKNPSLSWAAESVLENGADERITLFLNEKIFSLFGVSIPGGYVSLFWDNHSAVPAFRFAFWTLAASIFLFAFDLASAEISACFLLVYLALARFASPLWTGGPALEGDVLLALLSSGILFASVFLLQWPGTLPLSKRGKFAYAALGGVLAFIFCGTGTSPFGAIATILFLNLISPVIQAAESKRLRRRLLKLLPAKPGEGAK